MKFLTWTSVAIAACFCAFNLYAEDIKDSSTGETFPREVSFDLGGKNYNLQATGVATRKKLIATVYSVASYVQDASTLGSDKFAAILSNDRAKQLTLKWVRDVDSAKIQEGFKDSLKTSFGEEGYKAHEADINKFLGFFNHNVTKGEEQIIRSANGTVEVLIGGNKVGEVSNPEVAQGIWKIWFGDKAVVDRNNLVSLVK